QWEQNEAISKLAEEDLQEHIASLDEKYAVIFQLKAVEGYSHQEISELLGIKTEASRTIFSRARKQLRRLLTQHKVKYI
ncbi:MAG: sigma factor-like helix-turn-helix DNA-binding protein, partial [Bacteroidota bacterium]